MMLDKKNIEYQEKVCTGELSVSDDEYPHIFVNGEKISYHEFIDMMKKGGIK